MKGWRVQLRKTSAWYKLFISLKKKEETFFQPQTMASTPPQLRWGHWRGCPEIWQNRTKLAPKKNSKPPAQHNTLGCFASTTYILVCPSKKIKETIIYRVQFAKSLPSFSAFIKSNCVIYILSALWPCLRWLYDILPDLGLYPRQYMYNVYMRVNYSLFSKADGKGGIFRLSFRDELTGDIKLG